MLSSAIIASLLKLVHVWAVVLFVGNAALGPYRRRQARSTGDARAIAATYEIHTRSGPAVTVPWFAIAIASGSALAWTSGIPILSTGWVVWAIVLSLIVAVLFVAWIAPLQRQATERAVAYAEDGSPERQAAFERVSRRLEPLSHFAHVLFFAIIVLMVVKPGLPLPW